MKSELSMAWPEQSDPTVVLENVVDSEARCVEMEVVVVWTTCDERSSFAEVVRAEVDDIEVVGLDVKENSPTLATSELRLVDARKGDEDTKALTGPEVTPLHTSIVNKCASIIGTNIVSD